MELLLQRTYNPLGTNGLLTCNDIFIAYTIELPWRNNMPSESCIPEGRYQLEERYSEKHKLHLILRGIPGRTLILIHRANDAGRQLKGCIAPVSELTAPGKGSGSARAFNKLMRLVFKLHPHEKPLWLQIRKMPQDLSRLKNLLT